VIGGVVATGMGVALGWWFGADHMILMTMAPKSVTSPIAMLVAEQIGGVAALAAVFVLITGVIGAIFGPALLTRLGVHSPEARGNWDGKVYSGPLSHGRVFTKEEIWDNYTHFIKQVAPVAEEVRVHIGIHPDDPPVPVLAGVPRCIFGNFDGYKRAMETANSPNVGICLCCGTWLEGGKKLTGKDPEEMIRYFGARKIWKIHFRNVSAPLPHFVETFMDNGYYDMWKIMKALRDVNFDGIVILDHSPTMVGGNYAQTAYGFAYMKALLNRANAEAKG